MVNAKQFGLGPFARSGLEQRKEMNFGLLPL